MDSQEVKEMYYKPIINPIESINGSIVNRIGKTHKGFTSPRSNLEFTIGKSSDHHEERHFRSASTDLEGRMTARFQENGMMVDFNDVIQEDEGKHDVLPQAFRDTEVIHVDITEHVD